MKTTLINEDLTLVVEDAIPASTVYSPEEILALAVCASPNGSTDPGDLALLHAARERGIQLNYAQQADSWEAPSGERHYSTAILKAADKEDAVPFMVARGNLNALEKLCEVSNLEKERMNKAFEAYDPSGFQPVGIAVHRSGRPVAPAGRGAHARHAGRAPSFQGQGQFPLLPRLGLAAAGAALDMGVLHHRPGRHGHLHRGRLVPENGGPARRFSVRHAPLRPLRPGLDAGGGDDAPLFLLFHGVQQVPELPGAVPRLQTTVEGPVRHGGGLRFCAELRRPALHRPQSPSSSGHTRACTSCSPP